MGSRSPFAGAEAVRAGVGSCPRQPEGSRDPHPLQVWYPSREPALGPAASPGAGSEAGVGQREEGRPGECPRLSPRFHKSPQPRRPPGREVHGAGAQRGGTRHLPFPRRWLSFFQLFFFLNLSLLARVAAPAYQARSPLLLPGCSRPPSPPPLSAGTRGKRKLRGSACEPRGHAPGADAAALAAARRFAGAAPALGSGTRLGRFASSPAAAARSGDGGRPRSRAVAGRPPKFRSCRGA